MRARRGSTLFASILALILGVSLQGQAPRKAPATPGKGPIAPRPIFQEPEMARIPAGEFLMGADNTPFERERPVHRVYVSEFYIVKYVVSNAEYKRFTDASGHRPPINYRGERSEYTLWKGGSFPPGIARQPVINVSWDDADAYCRWLSQATGKQYRLPTEAEWEKAARGGLEQKEYPWGVEAPDARRAWFGKGFIRTWKTVDTLRDVDYGIPNGYGLYGMAGNVWQWVADWYLEGYYRKSPAQDPQGPGRDDAQVPGKLPLPPEKVLRGGSWANAAVHLRCAFREPMVPEQRDCIVGFRVARQ